MWVRSAAGLGTAQLGFVAVNIEEPWWWVNSIASSSLSLFPVWYVMEANGQTGSPGIHSENDAG